MSFNFNLNIQQIIAQAEEIITRGVSKLPEIESWIMRLIEILFNPTELVKQVILINILQLVLMTTHVSSNFLKWCFSNLTKNGRKIKGIEKHMSLATNYQEWICLAEELDRAKGIETWRNQDESPLYDAGILRKRIADIRNMIRIKDIFNLMFRLRGGLARDQFGVQNDGLYGVCAAGTKHIVEEYYNTIIDALNLIADADCEDDIPTDAKLAFFNEVRHSFGRTALLLSGGAALGYYHIGLARSLFVEGLLPRVISGASAGSIMAAIIGTRTDEEMMDMIDVANFRKDFFRIKAKRSNFISKFQYLLPQSLRWISENIIGLLFDTGTLLKMDTEHLIKVVMENVGLDTFQEAFDRTGRIINITVAPINAFEPPRLLNYLTAPHICVWSATVASCAIPGVFESVNLIVKEPDGQFRPENEWTRHGHLLKSNSNNRQSSHISSGFSGYSDGSIENDLPMQQLSELFNVNHFIVSQVNAHSAVLSTLSLQASVWSNPVYGAVIGYVRFLKAQLRDWLRNIIDMIVYKRMTPSFFGRRGLHQILTQEYEGREKDVTIMPWRGHLNVVQAFLNLIKNPTSPEFKQIVQVGQRNTWPFMPRIKAHCSIEMTLDRCVQRLRRQIAAENAAAAIVSISKNKLNVGTTGLDRTPSFYTTRSVVNLSGLSVLDPIVDLNRLQNETNSDPPIRWVGSNGSFSRPRTASSGSNDWNVDYDTNSLGPDVEVDTVPLTEEPPLVKRKPSNELDATGGGIMKSTSMANFYYKKSHSEEKVNKVKY